MLWARRARENSVTAVRRWTGTKPSPTPSPKPPKPSTSRNPELSHEEITAVVTSHDAFGSKAPRARSLSRKVGWRQFGPAKDGPARTRVASQRTSGERRCGQRRPEAQRAGDSE